MKKVLLLPMMLMGVALSFTSCGDNDDPGKDPDVVTYDFKNLPADSGTKPTEDQMSAVVATFVDEVALPTYKAVSYTHLVMSCLCWAFAIPAVRSEAPIPTISVDFMLFII